MQDNFKSQLFLDIIAILSNQIMLQNSIQKIKRKKKICSLRKYLIRQS